MKKNIYIVATVVLLATVSFGLYQYFRTPAAAMDLPPVFTGTAESMANEAAAFDIGDVVLVQDTIRSAESKSIALPHGVIVVRDSSDMQTWPSSGYVSVKGFYQGIEIDDFFGDTLIRVGGAFLLEPSDSEDLE
jgi:hypothetical protein